VAKVVVVNASTTFGTKPIRHIGMNCSYHVSKRSNVVTSVLQLARPGALRVVLSQTVMEWEGERQKTLDNFLFYKLKNNVNDDNSFFVTRNPSRGVSS
jgi:hypothetical protein